MALLSPSISTSSWFSVFSCSLCPPKLPPPLFLPTASISSMKRMQGAFFLAMENMSLTRAGPTPTNISRNSEPLTVMKGTLASPAVALARRVFPVPGGPDSTAPCRHARIQYLDVWMNMCVYMMYTHTHAHT